MSGEPDTTTQEGSVTGEPSLSLSQPNHLHRRTRTASVSLPQQAVQFTTLEPLDEDAVVIEVESPRFGRRASHMETQIRRHNSELLSRTLLENTDVTIGGRGVLTRSKRANSIVRAGAPNDSGEKQLRRGASAFAVTAGAEVAGA
eukprot:826069_1